MSRNFSDSTLGKSRTVGPTTTMAIMSSLGKPSTVDHRRVRYLENERIAPPPHNYSPYPYLPHPGMRIPPSPREYPYYEGTPPRWHREEYYSPQSPYGMPPRQPEDLSRPYMPPIHGEDASRMPPPQPTVPQDYGSKREGPPPPIRYRPSDYLPPSPKRAKRYPAPRPTQDPAAASPQKPGALSLLAKVANESNQQNQAPPENYSPVRREPPSPHSHGTPILWTPPHRYAPRGPPQPQQRVEWREPPPQAYTYAPRRDYYSPPWTYEGQPETPPGIHATRGVSFDDGYYSSEYPPQDQRPREYYPMPHRPPPSDYRARAYPSPAAAPSDGRPYISPSNSHDVEGDAGYHHHYQQQQQQQMSPDTYVQQPRLREKTILKKKFSWRNYPELEQFLISQRDEYLRHSALNYTAEQKQFNNWLTKTTMDVAERHNYIFDPADFNFVGVRDRIRCYYKSYVQTARKKGQLKKTKQAAAQQNAASSTGASTPATKEKGEDTVAEETTVEPTATTGDASAEQGVDPV